jgi:hypothetical protein
MAWQWAVPEYIHDHEKRFSEILVPTVETVKTTWLLKLFNEVGEARATRRNIPDTTFFRLRIPGVIPPLSVSLTVMATV